MSQAEREEFRLRGPGFNVYLLKSHHISEGFIKKNIIATKTPRH